MFVFQKRHLLMVGLTFNENSSIAKPNRWQKCKMTVLNTQTWTISVKFAL